MALLSVFRGWECILETFWASGRVRSADSGNSPPSRPPDSCRRSCAESRASDHWWGSSRDPQTLGACFSCSGVQQQGLPEVTEPCGRHAGRSTSLRRVRGWVQIFSSEPVLSSPKSVLLDQQREQGFGQVNVASCCRLHSVLNKILTFPVKAKFPAQLPGITTNTVLDCNSAYKYLGRR